jgi:hypothetical protein
MSLEPFGFPALDAWHGMRCAVAMAPHMRPGVVADPMKFMLRPPAPPEMTAEQTIAFFRNAFGGGTKKE